MKAILIPAVLLLLGTGAGVGAARFLMPAPTTADTPGGPPAEAGDHEATPADTAAAEHAPADDHAAPDVAPYVELPGQFIIPVVENAEVTAMIVLSLGLEVTAGSETAAQAQLPRLRASFLQALFDHANTGGFSGMFTASSNMRSLRHALLEAATAVLGDTATEVLILDLLRQDV